MSADGLDFISSFHVLLWSDTPKILRTRRELCVYLRERKRQALGKTIINVILNDSQPGKRTEQWGRRGPAGYPPRTRGNRVALRAYATGSEHPLDNMVSYNL